MRVRHGQSQPLVSEKRRSVMGLGRKGEGRLGAASSSRARAGVMCSMVTAGVWSV